VVYELCDFWIKTKFLEVAIDKKHKIRYAQETEASEKPKTEEER